MKLVFFGSGHFAVPAFKALIKSRHELVCVVTQPDKKKGRHLQLAATEIKNTAAAAGLKIFQPENVNSKESLNLLKTLESELFVIIAYGQILTQEVLDIPKVMSVNIHASLLPRYRGAAPINWAIINGDRETGVTAIYVTRKMDCGPVIAQQEISIEESDTAPELEEKLSLCAAELLTKTIALIDNRNYRLEEQDEAQAVYAPKLTKEMGLIDWNASAAHINNQIKGVIPWPGAFTRYRRKLLKIFRAQVLPIFPSHKPITGEVVRADKHGVVVACGRGFLEINELQLEAGKRMPAQNFIIGHKLAAGDILGAR
jgi:methionyl-tRNA formyltransferase